MIIGGIHSSRKHPDVITTKPIYKLLFRSKGIIFSTLIRIDKILYLPYEIARIMRYL